MSLSGSGQPSSSSKPSLSSGSMRALVVDVGDAVGVVVGIGAAVVVLEAVLVLGLERALVLRVEDAVLVVVGIGAAVVVLEAVLVLGLVRALVDVVEDAVAVLVARLGRRRCTCRAATGGARGARSRRRSAGDRARGSSRPGRARGSRTRGASRRARARAARTCRRRCRAPPWRWRAPGGRSAASCRPAQPATAAASATTTDDGRRARPRRLARRFISGFRPRTRARGTGARASEAGVAADDAPALCESFATAMARPLLASSSALRPNSMASSYSAYAGLLARLVQVLLGRRVLVRRVAIGLRELGGRDGARRLHAHLVDVLDGAAAGDESGQRRHQRQRAANAPAPLSEGSDDGAKHADRTNSRRCGQSCARPSPSRARVDSMRTGAHRARHLINRPQPLRREFIRDMSEPGLFCSPTGPWRCPGETTYRLPARSRDT